MCKKENLLTIVASKEDAAEYIDTVLKKMWKTHYEAWCKLRDKNKDDADVWTEYYNTVILTDGDPYAIVEMDYTKKAVANIFRMFNGCRPEGCSYEHQAEEPYYYDSIFRAKIFKKIIDLGLETQLEKEIQEDEKHKA